MAAATDDIELYENIRRNRVFRDRLNPLDCLDDDQLYEAFRFTRPGIYFLIEILSPFIRNISNRSFAVPPHLSILIVLDFFANGCFQRVTGNNYYLRLSQPTVSRCVRKVALALAELKNQFIKFPTNVREINKQQQLFYNYKGIPNLVSLIDGSHIRIICPRQNEEAYVNRHSPHSINTQIVCDFNYVITHICAKWPGSLHDSTILRESCLWEYFENHNEVQNKGILLGDSGYPCRNWLLTPYRGVPDTAVKRRFNR